MTKSERQSGLERLRKLVPYLLAGILTISIAAVGSNNKRHRELNVSLDALSTNELGVSVDQLSELYLVADLSDILALPSAGDVASTYVVANMMYSSGQSTSGGKLEKPSITDVPSSRGVIEYVVRSGDTMEQIAERYGLSTDEIRWSNGLKNTAISPGMTLYLPSTSGIVYLVESGDTLESIADRYGSNTDELIALNDLELSGLQEGMRIIVKGGSLPVTERPEYTPRTTYSSYTYLGNSFERQNITSLGARYNLGGPYVAGQCTQWAWYMRQDLPDGLGDARYWATNAARLGYRVDQTPSAGAIFQTSAGWYGHVGYVESVNSDGSIIITEMNYGYVPYQVVRATIPASAVGRFNYIH